MKKLKLNKETISQIYGGKPSGNMGILTLGRTCSAGCTDGCGPLESWFNCTKADCTNNCFTNPPSKCFIMCKVTEAPCRR